MCSSDLNGWRLTRADGTYFFYAHLSVFAPGLRVGSTVKAGQIIGQIGMTGAAGSPHLHFEVHPAGGAPVDPTEIVRSVDGCKVTAVPLQPGQTPVTSVPVTSAPATTAPSTTAPVTTAPTSTVAPVAKASGPASWTFVPATTVLDSKATRLAANTAQTVRVAGVGPVPADTAGVMVRATASNAATTGVLNVYACDLGPNGTSTLNLTPGRNSSTVALVRTSAGNVCAVTSTGAQVRLEVIAHLSTTGMGVRAQSAVRALDTRVDGSLSAGVTRTLSPVMLGSGPGSTAVTMTVTLLNPAAAGAVAIGPCGGTPWTIDHTAMSGQVFSGVVGTSASGVCMTSTGKVDAIVDVTGSWIPSLALTPIKPVRLYDSRVGGGTGIGTATTTVRMPLASGLRRAQFSVALVGGTSGGALYLWNCGDQRPSATVAYTPARTVTAVTVSLDVRNGSVCVASTGTLQAVLDVVAVG